MSLYANRSSYYIYLLLTAKIKYHSKNIRNHTTYIGIYVIDVTVFLWAFGGRFSSICLPLRQIALQASGVKIDSACKKAYDDLHNKHLHAFLIFRISDDDTTIIVDRKGDKGAPYSQFVEEIRKSVGDGKECRYAAVDVEVAVHRQGTDTASRLSKVVFIQYCPDDAPVRRRMLYASSVRALKATLGLESLMQVQASDLSDIDEKAIKSELMAHQRV